MRIGVLSDSHDNLDAIRVAIKLFNDLKVDRVFHAGDIVAPFSLKELFALSMPWDVILGNNDGEREGLIRVGGDRVHDDPFLFSIGERRLFLTHDIERADIPRDVDIVICGHTHRVKVEKKDDILTVNPGECGGWLTGRKTVAVVDLENLDVDIKNL